MKCESCVDGEPLFAYFGTQNRSKAEDEKLNADGGNGTTGTSRYLEFVPILPQTSSSSPSPSPMGFKSSNLLSTDQPVENSTEVPASSPNASTFLYYWHRIDVFSKKRLYSIRETEGTQHQYTGSLRRRYLQSFNIGLYLDATEFFEEFVKAVIKNIKVLSQENPNMVAGFQEIQFAYTENDVEGESNETTTLTVNLTQSQFFELKAEIQARYERRPFSGPPKIGFASTNVKIFSFLQPF